jgi:hypothetical protein
MAGYGMAAPGAQSDRSYGISWPRKAIQLPTDKEIVKPRCLASAASRRDGHIESVQRHRNHAIKPDEINELRRSLFANQVDGFVDTFAPVEFHLKQELTLSRKRRLLRS